MHLYFHGHRVTQSLSIKVPLEGTGSQPVLLSLKVVPLKKVQARFKDRYALQPDIDLAQYRVKAVVDWVELHFQFHKQTQFQHVQAALARTLSATPYIKALDKGPGGVSSRFSARFQDPPSLAAISSACAMLGKKIGFMMPPAIVGLEVSIDAYPRSGKDVDRTRMTAVFQRTFFTERDYWTDARDRLRFVTSVNGATTAHRVLPEDKAGRLSDRLLDPTHITKPFGNTTVYLGANDNDVSFRIQNKIADRRNASTGTMVPLPQDKKRARIEVTLRGNELAGLKLDHLQNFRTFRFARLQGRYFRFLLPSFRSSEHPSKAVGAAMERLEQIRASVFAMGGMLALGLMDVKRQTYRKSLLHDLKRLLRQRGRTYRTPRTGVGGTSDYVAYEELNRAVSEALRKLDEREQMAWERLDKGGV
ncbi:hypothetical protein [Halodurantibacterium flavum]|uniref:Uncharacterized protein n=1 Tax=Halodurantibacterium flavum TaxID=1382802 RepID=A0ABW4S576_9RHOB